MIQSIGMMEYWNNDLLKRPTFQFPLPAGLPAGGMAGRHLPIMNHIFFKIKPNIFVNVLMLI